MKYELVIFDCDGTLVDSEPVTSRLISKMMAEKGIELSPEACLENFAGKNIMYITDYMKERIGPFDHVVFEEDYRFRCLDLFDKELEAIPGALDLVKAVSVKKCIASNGPRPKMEVTLRVTGILDYFDKEDIFSAYDIHAWKPAPDLYLFACREMQTSPEAALVVEDTLPGVLGAVNAGIDVIVYNPEKDPSTQLEGVKNFTTMKEIHSYLKEKNVLKNGV